MNNLHTVVLLYSARSDTDQTLLELRCRGENMVQSLKKDLAKIDED